MMIEDQIIKDYLCRDNVKKHKNNWIYNNFSGGCVFEIPDRKHIEWVSRLYDKLKEQIKNYIPRNADTVKGLFPNFDEIAENYTVMLVVGFPDPYDAMVLEHDDREYMVFDLIQFGEDSLKEDYSCHRVLTHELIHICLHRYYPVPATPSYIDVLSYKAFDEGFAHALSFPEDISEFCFDDSMEEKFVKAKETLRSAISETDEAKQSEYCKRVDTGNYWDKFASISGKLYILKNKDRLHEIFKKGWAGFVYDILK